MLTYPKTAERWGVFEASLPGKTEGNPFTDYTMEATFVSRGETVHVNGFYDGDGMYRVRFMPSFPGEYTFTVSGSFSDEGEQTGSFTGSGEGLPFRVRGRHAVLSRGYDGIRVGAAKRGTAPRDA